MKISIEELEYVLKEKGIFYRDKDRAYTYKSKSDGSVKTYWQKGETYREFLERCEVLTEPQA